GEGRQGLPRGREAGGEEVDYAGAVAGGDRRAGGAEQGGAGEAESRAGVDCAGGAWGKAVGGGSIAPRPSGREGECAFSQKRFGARGYAGPSGGSRRALKRAVHGIPRDRSQVVR